VAWQTNLSPVEYLEKRLRYYKRKLTFYKNLIVTVPSVSKSNKVSLKKTCRKPYKYKVADLNICVKNVQKRVDEYQSALDKLKK
jgi:hypothetical protein